MTRTLGFVKSGQKLLKIVQMTGKWDDKCVKKKKRDKNVCGKKEGWTKFMMISVFF